MTTAGFIPVRLDAPLPLPPRYSILKAAQEVVDADDHWMGAAQLDNYITGVLPGTLDACDTSRAVTFQTVRAFDSFHGFTAYLAAQCTPFTIGADDAEYQRRLRVSFAAVEAQAVEAELEVGAAVVAAGETANPALSTGSPTLLASSDTTAVSPAVGIGALENYALARGGQGIIHCTPAIAEAAQSHQMLHSEGAGPTLNLYTILGTPVVPGGGYTGVKPNNASTAATVTKQWAYVSGGVTLRRGPVYLNPDDMTLTMDRANNLFAFSAQREYLAVWDTGIHAAVLIDLTK